MQVALAYGRGALSVELPPSCTVDKLDPPPRPTLQDPRAALAGALDRPVAGPPLSTLVAPGARVAVVVADWTRTCAYPVLLPPLLDELNDRGIGDEAIVLLVAYGTHTRQPDDATKRLYGETACQRVAIAHHDCDAPDLVEVGTTPAGTRVTLNPRYLDVDAAITVGAVGFHYFAGFGGGPKLVFPGLGDREAIVANHARYVAQMLAEPRRLKGELDGHACADDVRRAVAFAPPTFSIHGLFNARGELSDVIAGQWDTSHRHACERLRRTAMIEVRRPYDVVVASCGGAPRDVNLIQAHKSIDNACELLRDGGTLLIAAECAGGVGSDTFLEWCSLDEDAFITTVTRDYRLHGGTAFAMRRKAARCRIYMKTTLADEVVRCIGATPAPELQAALDEALAARPDAHVACVPNAAETVARTVPGE